MIPPKYQDTPPERIPVAETDDGRVKVKVIAGQALGKFTPPPHHHHHHWELGFTDERGSELCLFLN